MNKHNLQIIKTDWWFSLGTSDSSNKNIPRHDQKPLLNRKRENHGKKKTKDIDTHKLHILKTETKKSNTNLK